MKFPKITRSFAFVLALVMCFLVGCGDKKVNVKTQKTPWAVTEYNSNEIIDSKGHYITDKLIPATVTELKTVGNKKVIYHLDKPFLMRGMHFRYDDLVTARDYQYSLNKITDAELKKIFDDGMRLIKESGHNTVSIYLSLGGMYDGNKVDFSLLEYQYSVAKKYDLNIVITWFGHMVCGFGGYQSWQKNNLDKYPPLKDENGNPIYGTGTAEEKLIPDFSAKGFIEDEKYVLQQICAWLNVNDTDRRTVGIQIEDEPNNAEGGQGIWYSQYSNVVNFIGEMAKAVKESSYSMLTYTTLMSSGWDKIIEGRDFTAQIKGLIDLPYLDSTGYGNYTLDETPHYANIEQEGNLPFFVGFGACQWNTPAQTNYLLARGYNMCYYMLHRFVYDQTCDADSTGLYYFESKDKPFVLRDGSHKLNGAYEGGTDVVGSEFILMNHSILSLSELIAVTPNENMIHFNNLMDKNFTESKTLSGESFTFSTDCNKERYGSTGLLIKGNDTTYYTYASKTATIKVGDGIKSASEGVYKNGKWVKSRDVAIVDGILTYEAGKAYQFII